MTWVRLLVLLVLPCQLVFSQADGCAGAANLLTRVKEQISPSMSKDDAAVLYQATVAAIHSCRFPPESDKILLSELFYYRSALAEKLSNKSEVEYVRKELASRHLQTFTPGYTNPLVAPPAAATAASDESTSRVAHKWALVVGINQFQSPAASPLSFAVKDATDFATYLADTKGGNFRADRVKLLTNEKATFVGFREAFGWLRTNAQPEDLVVIYISSHGSPPEYDSQKVSYIVMNDTKVDSPNELYATSVQMIELVREIKSEIQARRVVLLLDTCFSGDASKAGRGESAEGSKRISVLPDKAPAEAVFSSALAELKTGVGRAVITASQADEESFEDKQLHNGYFTSYLIKTLRQGSAAQTLGDVFPKVRDGVFNSVRQFHPGKTQTPSCEFSDRASSIVLAVPEADTKVAKGTGGPIP